MHMAAGKPRFWAHAPRRAGSGIARRTYRTRERRYAEVAMSGVTLILGSLGWAGGTPELMRPLIGSLIAGMVTWLVLRGWKLRPRGTIPDDPFWDQPDLPDRKPEGSDEL
jgi:hypothetical protein